MLHDLLDFAVDGDELGKRFMHDLAIDYEITQRPARHFPMDQWQEVRFLKFVNRIEYLFAFRVRKIAMNEMQVVSRFHNNSASADFTPPENTFQLWNAFSAVAIACWQCR